MANQTNDCTANEHQEKSTPNQALQPMVAMFPPRPAWSASGVWKKRYRAGSAPGVVRAGKKFILHRPVRWLSLGH